MEPITDKQIKEMADDYCLTDGSVYENDYCAFIAGFKKSRDYYERVISEMNRQINYRNNEFEKILKINDELREMHDADKDIIIKLQNKLD